MKYIKNTMGIAEKQALEVAGYSVAQQAGEQEKQAAKLDYIAMMTDVDLSDIVPDETMEGEDDEQ